jgi:hypothetical protein
MEKSGELFAGPQAQGSSVSTPPVPLTAAESAARDEAIAARIRDGLSLSEATRLTDEAIRKYKAGSN